MSRCCSQKVDLEWPRLLKIEELETAETLEEAAHVGWHRVELDVRSGVLAVVSSLGCSVVDHLDAIGANGALMDAAVT